MFVTSTLLSMSLERLIRLIRFNIFVRLFINKRYVSLTCPLIFEAIIWGLGAYFSLLTIYQSKSAQCGVEVESGDN